MKEKSQLSNNLTLAGVLALLLAGCCGDSPKPRNYERVVYPPGVGAGHPGAIITDGEGTTIEILDVKVEVE